MTAIVFNKTLGRSDVTYLKRTLSGSSCYDSHIPIVFRELAFTFHKRVHLDGPITRLREHIIELFGEKEPHFVYLVNAVENRVVLNVQHGEVDVDYVADYVKVRSREPYNAARSLFGRRAPLGSEGLRD